MKLLIIGGVAAGAAAAARARRIDENAAIIMFEKGEYISYANCGLPYHVGNIIKKRESLFVTDAASFSERFNIDVRVREDVVGINPAAKEISVRKTSDGKTYTETYDKLLIATGAHPSEIPFPHEGIPGIMSFWTLPDMDTLNEKITKGAKDITVLGGGFVGIELVENFVHRGIKTTLIHRSPHLMSSFLDAEMARPIIDAMEKNGVNLFLNNEIEKAVSNGNGLKLTLKDGRELETDMLLVCAGVKPNNTLAKDAGLEIGVTGGIKVNDAMQTSNPDIYAAGDVVEIKDFVTGASALRQLAGPASKQGRIAADNIFGGSKKYKGTLGTSICKVFDLTVASAGLSENKLKKDKTEFFKTYIIPSSHASYYPGAAPVCIKLLFDKNGKILGAQIFGTDGVDKRIDVLASAMRNGLKVEDLEELELAYAPPYGSAKDPVNYAGFVAGNIISGLSRVVSPENIPEGAMILDVREPEEFSAGAIPGAVNIPLGDLRNELSQLPKDKMIAAYCKVGLRGYMAERILRQKGFNVKNMSGGYQVWKLFNPSPREKMGKPEETASCCHVSISCPSDGKVLELDVCGLQCPGPIVQVKNEIDRMTEGQTLKVIASDPGFCNDLPAWCSSTGNKLISLEHVGGNIRAFISKGEISTEKAPSAKTEKRATIILFSNDLDKAMAAFIIASGFASLGHEVSIFCTFWGLNVLRKDNPPAVKKDILSRMFGMMMPRGAKKLVLSKMHMMGMGTAMMKHVMASKNVSSLPELIEQSRRMGVKLLACEMAMNVMGIKREELIDGVETAGVANFAALSEKSSASLFI